MHSDDLLTPRETAQKLRIDLQTLANWRFRRAYRLPWIKVGSHIRYAVKDVQAFLDSRRRGASPEPAPHRKSRRKRGRAQ